MRCVKAVLPSGHEVLIRAESVLRAAGFAGGFEAEDVTDARLVELARQIRFWDVSDHVEILREPRADPYAAWPLAVMTVVDDCRGQIDIVDDVLVELLALRARLAARIQALRPPGRVVGRERRVIARVEAHGADCPYPLSAIWRLLFETEV